MINPIREWFVLLTMVLLLMASGVDAQKGAWNRTAQLNYTAVTLGVPFQIETGQVVFIENEDIEIQLLGVLEDSRCPDDLQCVWGGVVIVELKFVENGKNISYLNLSIGEWSTEFAFEKFDECLINLLDVVPHPLYKVKIEPSEYKAKLIVHRIDSLIQDLRDKDRTTQHYAIIALGSIRNIRAVEPLIDVLGQDNDSYVRADAATALGKINDTRAVDPLIQALNDTNSYVQEAAAEALKKLGWQAPQAQELGG